MLVCVCVRIGSMSTLGELPDKERKELVRSLAREIWIGVEHYGERPISLEEGVSVLVEKSGLLHDSNFYGNGFNEAQIAKLKEFREHQQQAFDIAEVYEKCIADVEQMAPGFARKSEELRRTWDTAHIMRELCKADSPFATLRTADSIDDQDRSDESNDDNDDDDDDDDYDEEGEDDEDDDSEDSEESDSDSDSEANKVLDKADEKEASDNGSDSDASAIEGSPPKRKKLERAAAPAASPVRSGDDSDLSDA